LCPIPRCDVTRWLFSLLFALDEAALLAAAQGGIRTEVGAIYETAFDSGQAAYRARPPDVFHHVLRKWVRCV